VLPRLHARAGFELGQFLRLFLLRRMNNSWTTVVEVPFVLRPPGKLHDRRGASAGACPVALMQPRFTSPSRSWIYPASLNCRTRVNPSSVERYASCEAAS
jgi:hypothetical protein